MLHGIMGSGIQLLTTLLTFLLLRTPTHPHHTHHPSTRPSPPPHGDQCEKPPGLIDRTWPPSRRNGSITTGQGCLPRGSCGDQVAEIGRAEINEGGMHICMYARYYSSFFPLYSSKRIFPDERTTLWFCVVLCGNPLLLTRPLLVHYSSTTLPSAP